MMTTSDIKRHINSLPKEQIFTTRDLLKYGLRNAVDQALFRLVNCGFITRLARGVFVKTEEQPRSISLLEIALVKAQAFGRTIITHPQDIAHQLGYDGQKNEEVTFTVNAHSSSFLALGALIIFKGASPRKFVAADTSHGAIARALWHLRETLELNETVREIHSRASRALRRDFVEHARWMPWWLSDKLSFGWGCEAFNRAFVPSG